MKAESLREGADWFRCVEVVAKNRMTNRQEMQTELMRSPGLGVKMQSSVGRRIESLDDFIPGDALSSIDVVDLLSRSSIEILSDRKVDRSLIFSRVSADERRVSLLNGSRLELI